MDFYCDYSDALIAPHTHWGCQWGLRSQGKGNSNSFRAILQQGLRNGDRLAGGKKSVHGFANFFLLVCGDWLYWELDVLIFVWDCYMISMIHNIWYLGFSASGFPIKKLCYVWLFISMLHMCFQLIFHKILIVEGLCI